VQNGFNSKFRCFAKKSRLTPEHFTINIIFEQFDIPTLKKCFINKYVAETKLGAESKLLAT
jgi:hypothetical protein